MLRFYVTGGVNNEHTAKVDSTSDERLDSLNIGGMFEAGSERMCLRNTRLAYASLVVLAPRTLFY